MALSKCDSVKTFLLQCVRGSVMSDRKTLIFFNSLLRLPDVCNNDPGKNAPLEQVKAQIELHLRQQDSKLPERVAALKATDYHDVLVLDQAFQEFQAMLLTALEAGWAKSRPA